MCISLICVMFPIFNKMVIMCMYINSLKYNSNSPEYNSNSSNFVQLFLKHYSQSHEPQLKKVASLFHVQNPDFKSTPVEELAKQDDRNTSQFCDKFKLNWFFSSIILFVKFYKHFPRVKLNLRASYVNFSCLLTFFLSLST